MSSVEDTTDPPSGEHRMFSGERSVGRVHSLTRLLSGSRIGEEEGSSGNRAVFRGKRSGGVSNGGIPVSQSQPGITEVLDDADRKKGRRRNPGDSDCLALLGKSAVAGRGKVFVRRKVAGLFSAWLQYNGEIRSCYGLFFPAGSLPDPCDERLTSLLGLISFRECELEVVKSPSKGDVLRVKRGVHRVLIAFEDPKVLEQWKQEIQRIGGQQRVSVKDFTIISPIGIGAGGKVFLVRRHGSKEKLAMKVVDKKKAVYTDRYHFQHTVDERLLLELCVGETTCVQLRYAFQTAKRFYYVMEFCEGGDIFSYMWGQRKSVGEAKTKYIAAQVLLALEHIHSVGFIYRDLKPENILIDDKGFIRVADFGLCKKMAKGPRDSRTSTVCGTFAYLAPEMLSGLYNSSVDVWTFGVFIYQLITGRPPCDARSVEDARRFIRRGCPVDYNCGLMSDEVIALLKRLIDADVHERMGCGPLGISEIRSHPYFHGVDWKALKARDNPDFALDVGYINRVVNEAVEDEQMVRNFDLDDLRNVKFEEDAGQPVEGDWGMFPLFNWQEDGGDLSRTCLLGFDFSYE